MKYAEITKLSDEERAKLEQKTRLELMKHRAQVATGAPAKDSGKIRDLRRDLARIIMAGGARK